MAQQERQLSLAEYTALTDCPPAPAMQGMQGASESDAWGEPDIIMFRHNHEEYCWLSNLHACKFVVDGVAYHSVEQFFHAEKMRLLGAGEQHRRIMAAGTALRCKQLGGKSQKHGCRLSEEQLRIWEGPASQLDCKVMFRGMLAKFQGDGDLRARLLATGDRTLAERLRAFGSKKWGVTGAENKGMNLAGRLLMAVREALR